MGERELEDLFRAFRERGDVTALAQVFDRTSDELMTIALHLVSDPAQAEDVVQATFLTAIQRAETYDATRALMPWLVGILANQAAKSRHERARVLDTERIEARVQPEPGDEMERAEVARLLHGAVDQLPEPYRAAVKRHVIDGERAVDIARQSGIAAGTVRMHILRGLERLRRALPAGLLGAGAWNVRGTDALRSRVLHAARAKARILASGATASTASGISATVWTIGGLLVTTKILLGVGVLVVAALFLWNLAPAHAPARVMLSTPYSEASSPPTLFSADATSATARRSVPEASSSASPSATDTAGFWVSGSVTGLDGKPAELTKITVRKLTSPPVTGMCDASGRFDIDVGALFEGPAPAELMVAADHPANRRGSAIVRVLATDAERGKHARVDLATHVALEAFALVRGRVECVGDAAHGRPQVKLFTDADAGAGRPDMVFPTLADPSTGSFVLSLSDPGAMTLRAACTGRLPASRAVDIVLGETADVGVLRLEEGEASIEGRVVLPFDHAAGEFRVLAFQGEASDRDQAGYRSLSRMEGRAQLADVDETGRFLVTGITRGRWLVCLWEDDRPFRSSDDLHIFDSPVECTASVRGLLLGADLGRLAIETTSKGKPRPGISLKLHPEDVFEREMLMTSHRGRTTLLVSMKLDIDVDLQAPGFDAIHVTLPAAARTSDMVQTIEVPDLGHGTIVLRPVGAAPPNVLVRLRAIEPAERGPGNPRPRVLRYPVKLVDGVYTLSDVPAGAWSIVVTPSAPSWLDGGGEFLTDAASSADVADTQTLVLRVEFRDAGRVRFEPEGCTDIDDFTALAAVTLVDAAGAVVPAMFQKRVVQDASLVALPEGLGHDPTGVSGSRASSIFLDAESELVQGLLPGDYRITIDGKEWISSAVSFHVQTGAMTTVRIPVRKR